MVLGLSVASKIVGASRSVWTIRARACDPFPRNIQFGGLGWVRGPHVPVVFFILREAVIAIIAPNRPGVISIVFG